MKNNNPLLKLKTLKKISPNKEWSLLAMEEIMQTSSPQLSLLQKAQNFVKIHNNTLKMFTASAVTAMLFLGFGIFNQPQNNLIFSNQAQAEINDIFAETEAINTAIRVEIDNNRVSEENRELIALLDKRHQNRSKLQNIISAEIETVKKIHQQKLSDQDIEILLLAENLNQQENFTLALSVIKNIEH